MSKVPDMEIKRNKQGYCTLFINGVFEGNYDTYTEAANAYDVIMWGEKIMKETVSLLPEKEESTNVRTAAQHVFHS